MAEKTKRMTPRRRLRAFAAKARERLGYSSVIERFAKGTAWTVIGNVAWRLLSLVSTILIGRILGPQGFGEFGILRSTANMFRAFGGFRLGITATKHIAEHRKTNPPKAGSILKLCLTLTTALSFVVSGFILVGAPFISDTMLNRPELAASLMLTSLLVFFLIQGAMRESALVGFESFKAIARVNAVRGVATLLLCVPLTYVWGVEGAIAGLTIVALFVFVRLSVLLKRESRKGGLPEKTTWKGMIPDLPVVWKFALPGAIAGAITAAVLWLGRVILTQQEGGFEDLGLFEAANQWRALILFLPAILTRVALPMLSETYSRDADKDFRDVISVHFQTICLITLPIVILTIALAGPLTALFGEKFQGARAILPVLLISVFFHTLNESVRRVYDGTGRRWINCAMYGAWAVVFCLSGLELIARHAALGLAMTHLVAQAFLFGVQATYVDTILVPKALRIHGLLLSFCLLLLALSYIFTSEMVPGQWHIPAISVLFLLSFTPIVQRLRAAARKAKHAGGRIAEASDD